MYRNNITNDLNFKLFHHISWHYVFLKHAMFILFTVKVSEFILYHFQPCFSVFTQGYVYNKKANTNKQIVITYSLLKGFSQLHNVDLFLCSMTV